MPDSNPWTNGRWMNAYVGIAAGIFVAYVAKVLLPEVDWLFITSIYIFLALLILHLTLDLLYLIAHVKKKER